MWLVSKNFRERGFADFIFQVGREGGEPSVGCPIERSVFLFDLEIDGAELMRAGDEQQRTVEVIDFIEENHCAQDIRRRHRVLLQPIEVILVPFPLVAIQSGLGVDLELVDIDLIAQQLRGWGREAFEARQAGKNLAGFMRGEDRANRAALLEDAPRFIDGKLAIGFLPEQFDLSGCEPLLDNEEAVFAEGFKLRRAESG